MNSTVHRTITVLASVALSTAACSAGNTTDGGSANDAGPSSTNSAPGSVDEPDDALAGEVGNATTPTVVDAQSTTFDESDPTAAALRDHFVAIGLDVPEGEIQCTTDAVADTTVMDLIAARWGTETFRPIESDMLPVFTAMDTCWSRDSLVEYVAAINVDTGMTLADTECIVGGIMALGGTAAVLGSDDQTLFSRIIGRCLREA